MLKGQGARQTCRLRKREGIQGSGSCLTKAEKWQKAWAVGSGQQGRGQVTARLEGDSGLWPSSGLKDEHESCINARPVVGGRETR